jgi:hypothetical protein
VVYFSSSLFTINFKETVNRKCAMVNQNWLACKK